MKIKSEAKHTPTPWRTRRADGRVYIDSGKEPWSKFQSIAVAPVGSSANAAFIVRAVNEYDNLLWSSKHLIECIIRAHNSSSRYQHCRDCECAEKTIKRIAQAEGK